jgi:hypothetical protein
VEKEAETLNILIIVIIIGKAIVRFHTSIISSLRWGFLVMASRATIDGGSVGGVSIDNTADIILLPLLISFHVQRQLILIAPEQVLDEDVLIQRQRLFLSVLAVLEAIAIAVSIHGGQELGDLGQLIILVDRQLDVLLDVQRHQV